MHCSAWRAIVLNRRMDGVRADLQNRRLCRKTDKRILAILMWIYFLQIFDKVVFGLGNTFGLSTDLGLTGAQYS
jgi:hypothetical protein